jgi:hypothetical protein
VALASIAKASVAAVSRAKARVAITSRAVHLPQADVAEAAARRLALLEAPLLPVGAALDREPKQQEQQPRPISRTPKRWTRPGRGCSDGVRQTN